MSSNSSNNDKNQNKYDADLALVARCCQGSDRRVFYFLNTPRLVLYFTLGWHIPYRVIQSNQG